MKLNRIKEKRSEMFVSVLCGAAKCVFSLGVLSAFEKHSSGEGTATWEDSGPAVLIQLSLHMSAH